jgi:tetratricopeptide (TPR) repeat protein
MNLYRVVGLQELGSIYDSNMKAFPVGLSQQPIFYPVLQIEYARQLASDWNVKSGEFAGYVTQFKVDDQYIGKFEEHAVGNSAYRELWIPAEELDAFNKHILGSIKTVEAYFGDGFQGFIPEKFGLQGKNAIEQFTYLANTYVYKRMDFYLEIRRNHKSVYLNYPFWQKYGFKNPGLKEKILKAIKEAWLTSFPQFPLVPDPIPEETIPLQDPDFSYESEPEEEENEQSAQANVQLWESSAREDSPRVQKPNVPSVPKQPKVEKEHAKPAALQPWENSARVNIRHIEQSDPDSLVDAEVQDSDPEPERSTASSPLLEIERHYPKPVQQPLSHFSQGVQLGLSGNDQEAVIALSRAVEEDHGNVAAYTSLGVAFHRLGEDDRALSCYETAIKLNSRYAEAHYFRANILYSQGNVRDAIAGYTIAMGLEPELIGSHQGDSPQDRLTDYTSMPSEIYWINKAAQRILVLNKLLEGNPRKADLFKERAAEYYRLWNYEQAVADYNSSLVLQPEDASAFHLRGVAYEQLGQYERAAKDYEQAISINPQLPDMYINRGIEHANNGNFRQAIASLTEGVRLAPGNPDIYFNRGMSYFQGGDLESAIDDYSRVIQISPRDEEAYYWRGISNEQVGRFDDAIADYKRFLELSQNPPAREEVQQRLRQWQIPE